MLIVFAVVLLVCGNAHGRIITKCELKETLEVMTNPEDMKITDRLIATFVCLVEHKSSFNTSLITTVQKNQDPFITQIMHLVKTNQEKPEEELESMEEEHIIPFLSSSPLMGSSEAARSQKNNFGQSWLSLLSRRPSVVSEGSGSQLQSEMESSGQSNSSATEEEEEESDEDIRSQLGIFQLNDHVACGSASRQSLNVCDLRCSALLDDDITDDITCLKTLLGSLSKLKNFKLKKKLMLNLMKTLPVKECLVNPSEYFGECS